ncbi:unnamed protein product, partial [Polarella glacialis]
MAASLRNLTEDLAGLGWEAFLAGPAVAQLRGSCRAGRDAASRRFNLAELLAAGLRSPESSSATAGDVGVGSVCNGNGSAFWRRLTALQKFFARGGCGHASVVAALVERLEDADWRVRQACLAALPEASGRRSLPSTEQGASAATTAATAKAAKTAKTATTTKTTTTPTTPTTRRTTTITTTTTKAATPTAAAAAAGVRALTDEAFLDSSSPAAVAVAAASKALSSDPSAYVREAAVQALGELAARGDSESATSALTSALTDRVPDVRHAALSALIEVASPR